MLFRVGVTLFTVIKLAIFAIEDYLLRRSDVKNELASWTGEVKRPHREVPT